MKKQAIKMVALAALVPSLALADGSFGGDTSSNSQMNESNSYASGSNSNYQINSNSQARNQVGSVVCAAPSLDMGIAGRSNNLDDTGMVFMTVNIPFNGSICEDAQNATLMSMRHQLRMDEEEQYKRNVLFQNKMAQVCLSLLGRLSIAEGNILREECRDFTPR